MNRKIQFSISFTILTFIFISFLPGATVLAQQSVPSDDEVNAIARQLYCPICENTPLDVCPTQACHDWREVIRQMLVQGKTSAEIKQYFVDHYGARVLSDPPRTGFTSLIYIFPPVVILIGVVLLIFAYRSWRRSPPSAEVPPANQADVAVKDEYAERLEKEMGDRK